uniref:Uncharacterized protein n=1 Tax=Tetranychus urticae TaxID=32264 RepID=T1L5E6_TETUR
MSSSQLVQTICGDNVFWDSQLSWNTTNPRLTECFQVTLLTGFPVGIMILTILTHAFREKRFDRNNWTFLKYIRLIAIIFASFINILYSLIITNHYYKEQYRVLLTYSIIQLVKATCYSGMMWFFLVTETVFSMIIYGDKWVTYDQQLFSEFVFYTTYIPVLVLLLILFCFNEEALV